MFGAAEIAEVLLVPIPGKRSDVSHPDRVKAAGLGERLGPCFDAYGGRI